MVMNWNVQGMNWWIIVRLFDCYAITIKQFKNQTIGGSGWSASLSYFDFTVHAVEGAFHTLNRQLVSRELIVVRVTINLQRN
jgi:hypothetical protein